MEPSSGGTITSLNGDLIYEILKRVDGASLGNAGCVSSVFHSVTREECMWEDLCYSLWPSTADEEVKCLIYALGGFQKFYADCFPQIVNEERVSAVQCNLDLESSQKWWSDDHPDEGEELCTVCPSDFVSIVDVQYKDKPVYSKVLWGIPGADDFHGWFSNSPFSIGLLSFPGRNEDEDGQATISCADGLPPLASIEKERKDGKFWRELWNNIRLSWILVNLREKKAVNLASWSPLGGKKHWPTGKDFLICFGSILPAHNILPLGVARCIIVMKCRVSDCGIAEGCQTTLKLTEVSMQLEDIGGAHVNGRNSLLILKKALNCCRSMNPTKALESYHQYLKAQSELKEEKIRNEGWIDRLCVLSGIAAFATFCFFML